MSLFIQKVVVPLENKIIMCLVKEYRKYDQYISGIGENFDFQIKRPLPNRLCSLLQIDQFKENHTLRAENATQSLKGEIYIKDTERSTDEVIAALNETAKYSCEKARNMGLPCSHIIAYYEKTNNNFTLEVGWSPLTIIQRNRFLLLLINNFDKIPLI